VELRHLRYFVAVAEELSFRRAAQRLHIAQPPLSQQIKQLETEVGALLLRRTSRHVELTDAGAVFLEQARRTLRDADQAIESARRTARGELGWLTVGFVDSAAYELLPPILRALRARALGVRLDLRELTTEQQLPALTDELDVGLVREVNDMPGLLRTPLLREPLLAAVPLGHPLASRRRVQLERLAAEQFVFFPRPRVPRVYDHLMALCRSAGFSPRTSQEALQYPTMLGLVAAGFGIALVPACVRALHRSGVAYVPLADDATSELSLVTGAGTDSGALDIFRATAVAVAAALPGAVGPQWSGPREGAAGGPVPQGRFGEFRQLAEIFLGQGDVERAQVGGQVLDGGGA
jgi:DNA-binding transcriptional LysR family regulator